MGDKPVPPANLVGDFGGGGMMLAFAMVSALLAVRMARDGMPKGQVIDCAMVDGSALLNAMAYGMLAAGTWQDARGVNLLDGAAHFYDSYECADGTFIAIGAIEPQFYAELRRRIGLDRDAEFDDQMNPAAWPVLRDRLTALFKQRPRDEWCALLEGGDAVLRPSCRFAKRRSTRIMHCARRLSRSMACFSRRQRHAIKRRPAQRRCRPPR